MRFKSFTIVTFSTLTIFTAGITSCSKGSGSSSSGISATVASNGFTPTTTVAFYGQSEQMYEIGGYSVKSGDTTALVVTIPSPITLNKNLTTLNAAIGVEYYVSNGKDYVADPSGGTISLTVTSLDSTGHKIAGNFTGTLHNVNTYSDSIMVTNGQFNTTFLVEP